MVVCLLVFLTSHLRDIVVTFTLWPPLPLQKSSSTIRQDGMQGPMVF